MRVLIVAASLLVLPLSAFAQQKPLITLSNIPQQFAELNTDEVNGDAPIELTWSADLTAFQTYRYELTYDAPRDLETGINPELVVLDDTPDSGRNMGTVTSGQVYRIRIRPSQILRAEDLPKNNPPLDLDDQPEQRSIVLQVFIPGQEGDDLTAASQSYTFDYDTRPPPPPTLRDALPGENRILVRWSEPASPGDVESWEVVYCPDGSMSQVITTTTSTTGYDIVELPCDDSETETQMASLALTEVSISTNVMNGIPVAVAVRSIDEYGNRGPLGNAKLQTPAATTDFWELYKGLGGEEDGGFCFVATAAHGSYAHPVVKVLRFFRDRVLKSSYLGTAMVWAYYHWSPPAAESIRHDPQAASWARIALLPISFFALLWTLLPFAGGAILIGAVLVSRFRARAALIAILLLAPAAAHADNLTRPDAEGWVGFGFEFKGGPYLPDMGRDTGVKGNDAFVRIFGSDSNPLYRIGFDLQLFRAFGTAGIGASFGFMQFVGKGVFGISENKSLDTTVFNIMPLTLEAFYRFDWLADHAPVPLVPYVRGGVAYYAWWITNSTGDISRFDNGPDDASDDQPGRGGKFGVTGSVGLALMLNFLEPQAAKSLHNSTGIRGTYLFGELQAAKVDGFGKDGFNFSELTWYLGMYLEF